MANLAIRIGYAYDAFKNAGFNNYVEKGATSAVPITANYYRQMERYSSMVDEFLFGNKNSEIVNFIRECPQVGAILLNKCNAYINGKFQVLNALDDTVNTSPYAQRLQRLLNRPNFLQNGKSFWAGIKFFVNGYGYCPVLRVKSETRGEISDLWILNPESIVIEWVEDNPFYKADFQELIKSIKLKHKTGEWVIPKEDVYIFTDSTPLEREGYLPSSRVMSGKSAITNLIKGYRTEGRIISKPLGAFSRKDASANSAKIPKEDKEKMTSYFSERYGTEFESQSDVLWLNAAVEWQNLMYPIAQLQIFEGRSANTAIVCDVMGYPFDLMGKDKGATYSNGATADKVLYQNHIVPEAEQLDQQIGECLLIETKGVRIHTSYAHVPCLQENLKEKAETRQKNSEAAVLEFYHNGCTYNEFLVSMNRPETKSKLKDLYYWEIMQRFPEFITNSQISYRGNQSNQANGGGNQTGNQGQANNNQG